MGERVPRLRQEFRRKHSHVFRAFAMGVLMGGFPIFILFFLTIGFLPPELPAWKPVSAGFVVWGIFLLSFFRRFYPRKLFISQGEMSVEWRKGKMVTLIPLQYFILRRFGRTRKVLEARIFDSGHALYFNPKTFERGSELDEIFQSLGRIPSWQGERFTSEELSPLMGKTFRQTVFGISASFLYPTSLLVGVIGWNGGLPWLISAPAFTMILGPSLNPFRTHEVTREGIVTRNLPTLVGKLIPWEKFIYSKYVHLTQGYSFRASYFYNAEGKKVLGLNDCVGLEVLMRFLEERTIRYPEYSSLRE